MGIYRSEGLGWGKWLKHRAARREKTEAPSSEDDAPDSPILLEAPSLPLSPPAHTPTYKKSLRLSSNQIVSVCRCGSGGPEMTVFPEALRAQLRNGWCSAKPRIHPCGSRLPASACIIQGQLSVPLLHVPAHSLLDVLARKAPSYVILKYLPAVGWLALGLPLGATGTKRPMTASQILATLGPQLTPRSNCGSCHVFFLSGTLWSERCPGESGAPGTEWLPCVVPWGSHPTRGQPGHRLWLRAALILIFGPRTGLGLSLAGMSQVP